MELLAELGGIGALPAVNRAYMGIQTENEEDYKTVQDCMRGEDVAEELKDAYFEAIRKRGRFSLYLDHPLVIRFLTREKWIKLSQIDALTEESVKTGNAEVTAMLLEYKHSAFSEKEIQKEERRKQRKSEKELERIFES